MWIDYTNTPSSTCDTTFAIVLFVQKEISWQQFEVVILADLPYPSGRGEMDTGPG
jgi:hypothetical protein